MPEEASPDADILRFDHPVREIPDQLAAFERAAVARWRQPEADGDTPAPDVKPQEDPSTQRLRVRRRSLLALAAVGVLFLVFQLTGFLPRVFLGHLPLLAFSAVLVLGATAQRVPRKTPQFQNPLNKGLFSTLAFYLVGGSFLNLTDFSAPRPDIWLILYAAFGVIALIPVVAILLRPGEWKPSPSWTSAVAPQRPEDWRSAALEACCDVSKKIGRNAPAGARATGWLDLGGAERRSKLVRDDRKERLYRDIWWRLRLPWEDGVRLRLAGVEEVRIPTGTRDRERAFRLLATLAVDPRRWRTRPGPLPAEAAGGLTVEALEVTPSRVTARIAAAQRAFQPADLVNLIKALEGRLEPLAGPGAPAPAGGEA